MKSARAIMKINTNLSPFPNVIAGKGITSKPSLTLAPGLAPP